MFERTLRILIPSALVLGEFVVTVDSSFGKAEYTKKEKKACSVCQIANGKKELNNAGKCYGNHNHFLEGRESKK